MTTATDIARTMIAAFGQQEAESKATDLALSQKTAQALEIVAAVKAAAAAPSQKSEPGGAGRLAPMRASRTATHYIGLCPVCMNRIKCQGERLVHHGYKRPGDGCIHGDCFGVGQTPHELSDRTAREYLELVVLPYEAEAQRMVKLLSVPEPVWSPDSRRAGDSMLSFTKLSAPDDLDKYGRRYHLKNDRGRPLLFPMTLKELIAAKADEAPEWLKGDQAWARTMAKTDWERALFSARHSADLELQHWTRERTRVRELIDTWKLLPLQTVEDEIAQAREKKSVAAQRKIDEVTAKMAVVLASSQARLDSAVKNRNANTVEDLFKGGYRKWTDIAQRINPRANRLAWMAAMDRDHVWSAFGLLRNGLYAEEYAPGAGSAKGVSPEYAAAFGGPRDAGDIMRPWNGWGDTVAPWPDALGGGKTKKR